MSRSAALVVTLGGAELRAFGDVMVALTGAPALATGDGRTVVWYSSVQLLDGLRLRLRVPPDGSLSSC